MKREVVSRCIINILNVKHTYDYERFSDDNMYEELLNYGQSLYNDEQYQAYKLAVDKHKDIIQKIVENKDYSLDDYNSFMEDLREFKRQYVLKK